MQMDPSDLELVRGVRATPALFNPMNSDFKFAYRKEKIWVELSTYLGINMNDARRRWTCLRDRYTRELKNRRLNPSKDHPQDDFFKEMDFLRPYVRKRKERRSIVCKIKSDTSWDGKLEKHGYNTCDSVYSSNNKLEINPCDSNYSCNKMEANANCNPEEVNVEEIFHEYEVEKVDTISMVEDPNNIMPEEADEEPLMSEENYEEYQVQSSPGMESVTGPELNDAETPRKAIKLISNNETDTEDDFFCKSIRGYLRQLSRVHKIKAKVEMFQILQKYIEIEES